MSQNRTPAGVPTGGQFAASVHQEAAVSLAVENATAPAPTAQEIERERVLVATEQIQRLVARETSIGMTPVERQEDVEFDLRQDFPYIASERFDSMMATIGRLAEQISTTEAADYSDTDAYAAAAEEVGKTLDDYPAEDPGYDDAYYDASAFKSGVIDELDQSMYVVVLDLVREDAQAKEAFEQGQGPEAGHALAMARRHAASA